MYENRNTTEQRVYSPNGFRKKLLFMKGEETKDYTGGMI